MAKDWKTLVDEIEAETKRIWLVEPEDMKKLRLGIIDNGAGSYGQYWTTWDFANGMMRDYSMYTLYPILKLAERPEFDVEHIRQIFIAFDPPYSTYLGYSGYRIMEKIAYDVLATVKALKADEKEGLVQLLRSFVKYTNKLAAWSFHYFPWGLGAAFPLNQAPEIIETACKK